METNRCAEASSTLRYRNLLNTANDAVLGQRHLGGVLRPVEQVPNDFAFRLKLFLPGFGFREQTGDLALDDGQLVHDLLVCHGLGLLFRHVRGTFPDRALSLRVLRQRDFVQRNLAIRNSHDDISESKLDLLITVCNLSEKATGRVGPFCKCIALLNGQLEEEGVKVHPDSLPAGAFLSNLQVNGSVYLAVMDRFDLRREVIARIIKKVFDGSQARFAEAADLSPTYVTRMLKDANEPSRKRIAENLARRLESIPALGLLPNELLDPKPPARRNAAEEVHEPIVEYKVQQSQTLMDLNGAEGQLVGLFRQLKAAEQELAMRRLIALARPRTTPPRRKIAPPQRERLLKQPPPKTKDRRR